MNIDPSDLDPSIVPCRSTNANRGPQKIFHARKAANAYPCLFTTLVLGFNFERQIAEFSVEKLKTPVYGWAS